MYLHFVIAGFISITSSLMWSGEPVALEPVEGGVADRGSLSDSLRIMPTDLRQNQSFEKLYRVVGSEGVYIRQAGGLRAVFKNPVYVDTVSGSMPIVPAGTVYCIGEVTQDVLRQLGILVAAEHPSELVLDRSVNAESPEPIYPSMYKTNRRTIQFLDDETYRRQRLAMFVLDVALK